jgi:hypothetical protein
MKTPQDLLPRFHMLVKNRLGPYKIIVSDPVNSYGYVKLNGGWTFNKNEAHDYTDMGKQIYEGYKTYLTTAAGEIELLKKDFIPKPYY